MFIWHCFDQWKHPSAVEALAHALKVKDLWRLYPMPNNERVLLGCSWKRDLVFVEGQNIGAGFVLPFDPRLNTMQKRMFADANEVSNLLHLLRSVPDPTHLSLAERLANEPDSDLNKARRWLAHADNEWALLDISSSRRQQLESLLSAMIVLSTPHNNILSGSQFCLFQRASGNTVRIYYNGSRLRVPASLLHFLNDHFRVKFVNRKRTRAYSSWYDCTSNLPRISFSGSVSKRKKKEALLVWREFLRDKLPPAEIELLLKPVAT